jgi:flagellar basal-body rod protein FlgB
MNKFQIGKTLFDKTMSLVQRSLDIRAARHQVISGNVANVETPGYVSKDLPFQKVFERTMEGPSVLPLKRTHPHHLPALEEERTDFSRDIEVAPAPGVDIDQQMAKLAENNLMFQSGIQSLIKKFEALKVSVNETR